MGLCRLGDISRNNPGKTLCANKSELYLKVLSATLFFLSLVGVVVALVLCLCGVASVPICCGLFVVSQLSLVISFVFFYKQFQEILNQKTVLLLSKLLRDPDCNLLFLSAGDITSDFIERSILNPISDGKEEISDSDVDSCEEISDFMITASQNPTFTLETDDWMIEEESELGCLVSHLKSSEFFSSEGHRKIYSHFRETAEQDYTPRLTEDRAIEARLILHMELLSDFQKAALIELAKHQVIDPTLIHKNKNFFINLLEYPFLYSIIRNRCYEWGTSCEEEQEFQWYFPNNDLSDFHDNFYFFGNAYSRLNSDYNAFCKVVADLLNSSDYSWPGGLKDTLRTYYLLDEDQFFCLSRFDNPIASPIVVLRNQFI